MIRKVVFFKNFIKNDFLICLGEQATLEKENTVTESTTEESNSGEDSNALRKLAPDQNQQLKKRTNTPMSVQSTYSHTPKKSAKWNPPTNSPIFTQSPMAQNNPLISSTTANTIPITPASVQPLVSSQPWSNGNQEVAYPNTSFPAQPPPQLYNQYPNYYNNQSQQYANTQPQPQPYFNASNNQNYNPSYKPQTSSYPPFAYNSALYNNQATNQYQTPTQLQYGYTTAGAPLVPNTQVGAVPYQSNYYPHTPQHHMATVPPLGPILPSYNQATYPTSTATPPPQLPANRPDLQSQIPYNANAYQTNQFGYSNHPVAVNAAPAISYPMNNSYYTNPNVSQYYNGYTGSQ